MLCGCEQMEGRTVREVQGRRYSINVNELVQVGDMEKATHGVGGPQVRWRLFGPHSSDQNRRQRRCCVSKCLVQETVLYSQPGAAEVSLNLVTCLPWLATEDIIEYFQPIHTSQ